MPVVRYEAVLLGGPAQIRQIWKLSSQSFTDLSLIPSGCHPSGRDTPTERRLCKYRCRGLAWHLCLLQSALGTGGAAFRFAANAIYLQRVCVSLGDIKRHHSRFSSHLILRKLSRPVMNHFIFFSGWWRQAFPSQTHCVPVLKGPQTVIQNIRYYIFPSAGRIITGPSVALFARELCTRAPRPLCCFYFLLKTICNVRGKKGATF